MVLVVITPAQQEKGGEYRCAIHDWWLMRNINRKRRQDARLLPEVFSTVDAREDLAFSTTIHMIFDLSLFQGFATGITGKENHFNDTLTS